MRAGWPPPARDRPIPGSAPPTRPPAAPWPGSDLPLSRRPGETRGSRPRGHVWLELPAPHAGAWLPAPTSPCGSAPVRSASGSRGRPAALSAPRPPIPLPLLIRPPPAGGEAPSPPPPVPLPAPDRPAAGAPAPSPGRAPESEDTGSSAFPSGPGPRHIGLAPLCCAPRPHASASHRAALGPCADSASDDPR